MPSSSSLDRLFASAAGAGAVSSPNTKSPGDSSSSANYDPHQPGAIALPGGYTKLPSGIVLDASGKPCKQCTSGSAWRDMMRKTTYSKSTPATITTPHITTPHTTTPHTTTTTDPPPPALQPTDCPTDVDELGRNTWTLLHSIAATYPPQAPPSMQATMRSFIATFSQLYPCGTCAEDFQLWMRQPGNDPRVGGQDELGMWMCEAHNAVNVKLGKAAFDCALWKQRWRDGWADGRCD
ncbi:hypothetical protein DV736_g4053, partial [Chaetothyriales sp. CBS 134916]